MSEKEICEMYGHECTMLSAARDFIEIKRRHITALEKVEEAARNLDKWITTFGKDYLLKNLPTWPEAKKLKQALEEFDSIKKFLLIEKGDQDASINNNRT